MDATEAGEKAMKHAQQMGFKKILIRSITPPHLFGSSSEYYSVVLETERGDFRALITDPDGTVFLWEPWH